MLALALPILPVDNAALDSEIVASPGRQGAEVREDASWVRATFAPLLTTTSPDDFLDLLDELTGQVDEWALGHEPFTHRPYEYFELESVLGRKSARRYMGGLAALSEGVRSDQPQQRPKSYAEALYSQKIHPFVGLSLAHIIAGYAAHMATLVALQDGKRLPEHVAEGLARAVVAAAGASAVLASPRH